MTFGIADSSIIPMRREKSGRSEMVSQLLFGEVYEVLEFEDKWLNIRLLHDGSSGWIDRKSYKEVGTEFVERYRASDQLIMSEVFNLVVKKGDWENKMIVAGSVLPFYDAYAKKLMIGEEEYVVRGFLREVGIESLRELLIQYALMFYNAPYRWGGRTPNGVDSAALVQMVYRLAGMALPRYIEQQVAEGQTLSFLEEAQSGDLAFFGDNSGAITHVGILWEQGRIIHASGKVRVDKIDHHGIFNEEMKRYTHTLKVLKQFF